MSRQTVRSGATGARMLCCWSDCERFGYHSFEHHHIEGNRRVTYVFCSERHRAYWRNSVHDNGNLPTGSKGMMG